MKASIAGQDLLSSINIKESLHSIPFYPYKYQLVLQNLWVHSCFLAISVDLVRLTAKHSDRLKVWSSPKVSLEGSHRV
jgi:hypothetical protein